MQTRHGSATIWLKHIAKDQIERASYALDHAVLHRRSARLLLEILRRFDRIYRDRKRQAGALDFSDLEEFSVRLLEEHPETTRAPAGAVRPRPDG